MLSNEKIEDLAMMIISNAGAGKGAAFEALNAAKQYDFDSAVIKMKQANDYIHDSHASHSTLLQMDARGELNEIDLLLTHAQDHVMTAQLAIELIGEIVALRMERNSKDTMVEVK